jgi:hypothetical protein
VNGCRRLPQTYHLTTRLSCRLLYSSRALVSYATETSARPGYFCSKVNSLRVCGYANEQGCRFSTSRKSGRTPRTCWLTTLSWVYFGHPRPLTDKALAL